MVKMLCVLIIVLYFFILYLVHKRNVNKIDKELNEVAEREFKKQVESWDGYFHEF